MKAAAITRHTPVSDLPELLRPEEAAVLLACGRGTIYSLAASGELASVRVGRLLRIPRSAIAALAGVRDNGDVR